MITVHNSISYFEILQGEHQIVTYRDSPMTNAIGSLDMRQLASTSLRIEEYSRSARSIKQYTVSLFEVRPVTWKVLGG